MTDGVWDSHGMEYGRVMRMLQDGVDAPVGPWEMSGLNDRCADTMQLSVLRVFDSRMAVISWLPYAPSCPGGRAGKPWVHERSATTGAERRPCPHRQPPHHRVL